ncbi:hypothetical protein Taro_048706 [Colocasia esculenta]|uniref:Uncharacterized protein n=1 Tax=Colocasia esculenta TaxID=4460 RepID=A0A843X8V9_COLES|nr:hypothetical protein [Colocasia esculenta]
MRSGRRRTQERADNWRNLPEISAEEHGTLTKISAEEPQRMGEAEQSSPISPVSPRRIREQLD